MVIFWVILKGNKLTLLHKLNTDYFSLCQSDILSVLFHEEIYLNICRNVRGVLTFVIHCKKGFALNKLLRLICHKTQLTMYYYYWNGGLMSRVFANGPGDCVSVRVRVIPKTQKMVLDAALLNTQYYKVSIKDKRSNLGNGVEPHWCCSYWKGNPPVTLDYGHQIYELKSRTRLFTFLIGLISFRKLWIKLFSL